ncbi:hypothetical protein ECPA39_3013, partial [Escherichia coli PA39]
MRPSNKCEK